MGDPILRREFKLTMEKLKDKKAPGTDNIPAELNKNVREMLKEKLYQLLCKIYIQGKIPTDFEKCIVVPITKKNKAI